MGTVTGTRYAISHLTQSPPYMGGANLAANASPIGTNII